MQAVSLVVSYHTASFVFPISFTNIIVNLKMPIRDVAFNSLSSQKYPQINVRSTFMRGHENKSCSLSEKTGYYLFTISDTNN